MITAIIIDDEQHCIDTLKEKIKVYCPFIEVVASFNKPSEAIEYLTVKTPDVVFLDIEMPVINGFSLLEKLGQVKFKIVFTTAYDQFAIKAIKFSAFDYLLKPISKDDLVATGEKIKQGSQNLDGQLKVLMQQLSNTQTEPMKISISTSEGMIFPYINDIVRVESSSNYSTIYFTSGKKIMVSRTLKDFDELLTPHNFFRIHNSHLINFSKITKYHKVDGGYVELENGDKIEVSRRRKDEFMGMLNVKL